MKLQVFLDTRTHPSCIVIIYPTDEIYVPIINVVVKKDQGVIAVDTLTCDVTTPDESGTASRVLLLPHGQMLLACRNHSEFFFRVYCELLKLSNTPNFDIDQAEEIIPRLLDVQWRLYAAERSADESAAATVVARFDLVAVGWSDRDCSVVARVFSKADIAPARTAQAEGGMASPGHPLHKWKGSTDEADLLRAARAQVHYQNLVSGGTVAGGDLLIASITQSGVEMKRVASL